MAIATGMVTSLRSELWGGQHNVHSHTLKGALYTTSATLNSATTYYTATNEISGTGYSAGGKALTSVVASSAGSSGIVDAADIVWTASSFTAAGLLIYNDSHADNAALTVFDFGGNRTVSNGTFTVQLPAAGEGTAFLEIDDA